MASRKGERRSDASSRQAANTKGKTERSLDRALKDTFPASDPVPPPHPTGADDEPGAPIDRKTPEIDADLVEELARGVRRSTRNE